MRSITKLELQYAHRFYGFKGEAQYLHGHTGVLTLEVEDTIEPGVNMVFPCNEIQKTAWSVLKNFDHVCSKYDYVTAEGSGGILCPLRYDEQKIQLEDFIKARSLACLMIADAGLGTINAAVLTAEYMKARQIPVKGIIFNHYVPGDPMHEDNRLMCEAMTGLKVIACVKDGDTDLDIPFELLEGFYEENGGGRK